MHILIDNNSDKPIYEQVVEGIKERIVEGQLKSGDLLPSIRKLAKDLNISTITTKRAYLELEKADYLTVIGGKGSYVKIKSNELLKEEIYKKIELKLADVIEVSKRYNVSKKEVLEMFDTLYEEVN